MADAFLIYIKGVDAELSARWGQSWVEVPEAEAASTELFGFLATYLAEVHMSYPQATYVNAGQHYDTKTAEGIWSGLVQTVKVRFGKSTMESTKVRARHLLSLA